MRATAGPFHGPPIRPPFPFRPNMPSSKHGEPNKSFHGSSALMTRCRCFVKSGGVGSLRLQVLMSLYVHACHYTTTQQSSPRNNQAS